MKNKRKSLYLKLLTMGFSFLFGLVHYWIHLLCAIVCLIAALYYLLEPDDIIIGGKYRMKANSVMYIEGLTDLNDIYTVLYKEESRENLWVLKSDKDNSPICLFTYELEPIEK